MRTQFSKFALAAAFGLALAFTLSCSSDKDDDPSPQPLPVSSGGNSGVDGSSSSVTTGSGNGSSSSATSGGELSSSGGNGGVDGSSSSVTTGSGNGSSSSATSGGGSSSSATASGGGSSSSVTGSGGTSSSAGSGGVVYGADVTYQGGPYKTVVIGGKTWFQRNLNYAVEGSKCSNGEVLSDANTAACDTYGRLYNWATAMALPSKCNSKLSTSDADCAITTPHKGICPTGWHIPSDAEWTALETAVGGEETAGKYLKARNGWNENGNGTDDFGFSALPGGIGFSDGIFYNVGYRGRWWSASEYSAYGAYGRYMLYNYEYVDRDYYGKSGLLLSVRCLQD